MASNTSSHPGSLFQFFLHKELALANSQKVLGESIALVYTKKLHFSSFHLLINRKKNLDEEILAEPSSDAAMKDRLQTDGYMALLKQDFTEFFLLEAHRSSHQIFTHVT